MSVSNKYSNIDTEAEEPLKKTPLQKCVDKIVTIVEGVTEIDDNAYKGCTNLETINIPESLIYLGENAFNGCTNLKTINLPSGENEGEVSIDEWFVILSTTLVSKSIV